MNFTDEDYQQGKNYREEWYKNREIEMIWRWEGLPQSVRDDWTRTAVENFASV